MTHTPPEAFFSNDYYQARARFLDAAKAHGARLVSVEHPSAKGPGGKPLHMDCAVLGSETLPHCLIVISATHGPEGYCGSGVQTGLLETGLAAQWAKAMRVILVHAHNPYGFAWDSRFNEDNIDLNRNYLASFDPPLPANPNYDRLAHWAAPEKNDPDSRQAAERGLLEFAAENGFAALQSALSGGQYAHPKGVYFGGLAPSWSNITLHRLLGEATAGASRIVSIDMHTGLGPFGHGEIITESAPESEHYARQTAIWGDQIMSTKDGSSVSADLQGTMDTALLRAFAGAAPTVIALEFGTTDPMSVFRATQGASWLHCYGDKEGPDADALRLASRAAFYPDTDEWKQLVWARSLDVIGKAAGALGR
jgi:predicted deacylase